MKGWQHKMNHQDYIQKTKNLIDGLKTICSNYGLGNTGSEYKIITEVFLYKFLNDKFFYEMRRANQEFRTSSNIEQDLLQLSDKDYEYKLEKLGERAAKLKKEHFRFPFMHLVHTRILTPQKQLQMQEQQPVTK